MPSRIRPDRAVRLRLYSDGSSHASGGKPIGWCWIIVELGPDGVAKPLKCGTGGMASGSNNVAELCGIRDGLDYVWFSFGSLGDREFAAYESLEVVSDSQYALGAASGKNAVHANADLVQAIRKMVVDIQVDLPITFAWVRGHSGEEWQERTDRLAVRAKEKQMAALKATP